MNLTCLNCTAGERSMHPATYNNPEYQILNDSVIFKGILTLWCFNFNAEESLCLLSFFKRTFALLIFYCLETIYTKRTDTGISLHISLVRHLQWSQILCLIWGLSRPESFVDGYMIHFRNNWQTTLPLWSKILWLPNQDPHYWPRISARCINHGTIASAKDCANKHATDFWASVRKEEEEEGAPKSSIWQTEPRGWNFRCQRQPRKSVQEYRLQSQRNTASSSGYSTPKLHLRRLLILLPLPASPNAQEASLFLPSKSWQPGCVANPPPSSSTQRAAEDSHQ